MIFQFQFKIHSQRTVGNISYFKLRIKLTQEIDEEDDEEDYLTLEEFKSPINLIGSLICVETGFLYYSEIRKLEQENLQRIERFLRNHLSWN
jgi:hypothetical protein